MSGFDIQWHQQAFLSWADLFCHWETHMALFSFLLLFFCCLTSKNKAELNQAVCHSWQCGPRAIPLRLLGLTPVGFPSGPPCLPLMTSGPCISWLRLLSVGQTTSLTKPHSFIGGRTKSVHTAESIPLITQFRFYYFMQAHQRWNHSANPSEWLSICYADFTESSTSLTLTSISSHHKCSEATFRAV